MAKGADFTEVMLRKGLISPEQLAEAQQLAKEQGKTVADCLIHLEYAASEDVARAMADHHGMRFVNLSEINIPDSIIEFVPEAVARENSVLPLSEEDDVLTVVVSEPIDLDTLDKLRFILNRRVEIGAGPRRSDPRSDQPALRPDRRRICGLDAAGVHRYGHRLHRDARRVRRRAVDENSAPVVRLVHC